MAAVFQPNRALLNSKFEGYKLDAVNHEDVLLSFPLAHKLSQIAPSAKSPLTFQEARLTPLYHVLYELPRQIKSDVADAPHEEYPSVAFLDAETLFASDGTGTLYALRLGTEGPAKLVNTYELSIAEPYHSTHSNMPFKVHSADQPLKLDIVWHRRGGNVPSYVEYIKEKQAFMLLGSFPYQPLSSPTPPSYQPSSDEIVPIPRAGEDLDGTGHNDNTNNPKPPPYSWTQSSDQVTIAFPLPSSTPKDAIKVAFSPTTLTVLVSGAVDSVVPLPHYSLKKLWAPIQSSDSLWTFDRSAEHTYGLLTLHLDKQHEGTRWPQVFAASSDPADAVVDVPETLDPSELYQIREALEKYTSALQTGEDASGLGLGRGIPSLAEGEIDEEVDMDMGDLVVLTWVTLDGFTPDWLSKGEGSPFSVLSTPLQGSLESRPSLVVKTGLDGAVYTLDTKDGQDNELAWTHTSTFCVLSFVLASKRDTRFIHHVGSKAVFAFESGAREMGCNAYIYRNTVRPRDKAAKQCILKLNDGSGGPLLGVGMIRTKDGRDLILCLCEGQLIVIHDLL
ncbi:hypothetical protein EIP86_008597 [Pleurotus ostreatoroseus]|nr:hypothetical protein EIP86_008597 [Pleurotus ostreatoroseus]